MPPEFGHTRGNGNQGQEIEDTRWVHAVHTMGRVGAGPKYNAGPQILDRLERFFRSWMDGKKQSQATQIFAAMCR